MWVLHLLSSEKWMELNRTEAIHNSAVPADQAGVLGPGSRGRWGWDVTAADRGDRLPAQWQMPLRSLLVSVAWTGFSWSSNQWNTVAGGLWWFHYVMPRMP